MTHTHSHKPTTPHKHTPSKSDITMFLKIKLQKIAKRHNAQNELTIDEITFSLILLTNLFPRNDSEILKPVAINNYKIRKFL